MGDEELVRKYQYSLEKYYRYENEEKILYYLGKVSKIRMSLKLLENTGIGKTVNSAKKFGGRIADIVKEIIKRWRDIVCQETEKAEPTSDYSSEESAEGDKNGAHTTSNEEDDEDEDALKIDDEEVAEETVDDKLSEEEPYEDEEEIYSKAKTESGRKYESKEKKRRHSDDESSKSSKKQKTDYESNKKSKKHREEEKKCKEDWKHRDDRKESKRIRDEESRDDKDIKKYKDNERRCREDKDSKKCRDDVDDDRKNREDKDRRKYREDDASKKERDEKKNARDIEDRSRDRKYRDDDEKKNREDKKDSKHKSVDKSRYDSKSENKEKSFSSSSSKHSELSNGTKSSTDKTYGSSSKSSSEKEKYSKDSSKSKEDKQEKSEKEKSKKLEKSRDEKRDGEKQSKSKDDSNKIEKSSSKSSSSDKKSEKKSSSDSSNHRSKEKEGRSDKSRSEKSKDKKIKVTADGIDCESGASFAEALGMLAPVASTSKSPKKKASSTPSSSVCRTPFKAESVVPVPKKKLEAVDLNLASLLPAITPNYRPMGFDVMMQPKQKTMTDEETLSYVISSKKERTKVYSGNKFYGKVPSLFESCVRVLQDNIDALEYTGGVPYDILKPILEKANTEQLFILEHHNPYLMEDTDELWEYHCQRDFRNKKREEMESFREMFLRCTDEREARLKVLTSNIKLAQEKSTPVRQTKLAYVDSVAKPPRNIAKKQAKYGIPNKVPIVTPASRLSAKGSSQGSSRPPTVSVPAPRALKPIKKAPLMQKTLAFMKGRFGRK